MLSMLVWAYVTGWLAATIVVFVASDRLCEPGLPGVYRFVLSFGAGFVWPLLLIGAAEFTSLAWFSNSGRIHAGRGSGSNPDEMRFEQTIGDVLPIR